MVNIFWLPVNIEQAFVVDVRHGLFTRLRVKISQVPGNPAAYISPLRDGFDVCFMKIGFIFLRFVETYRQQAAYAGVAVGTVFCNQHRRLRKLPVMPVNMFPEFLNACCIPAIVKVPAHYLWYL